MIKGIRILSPEKMKAARGSRRPADIVRNGNGAFSEASYSQWENGRNTPTNPAKQAALVLALGVKSYEDISIPYEIPEAQAV